MSHPDFAHLHVHSEYSLLDGANRIDSLVEACERDGQRALALTDHGNMFGALELYQKCNAADITPILGCEVYVARDSRLKPHSRTQNPYSHLTLLAKDRTGYQNLLQLASISYLEGFHFRPRIDRGVLARHGEGLLCLSGCLSGEINQLFRNGKQAEAENVAAELRDIFGANGFWIELQRNGMQIQDDVNTHLVDLSKRTGIPLIATNDIHYLRHEDCQTQDVLLCINTGAKRDDEKRFKMDTDSLFFRTREEMAHLFRDVPEAVTATMDAVEQVDLKLEFGKYHLPVFTPDNGESPDALFDRLCDEGMVQRYGSDQTKARERLAYEKTVIREMDFVSYFLIVWDLIKWARDHDIPVGPGRGSAAGSIVSYVLDITRIDPLKYDLLFERFLNSARISMPDIDIDFCKEGRERVLEYTRERYGNDKVAQIGTFATMASRSVVRDVGRVLDLPLGEIDRLAKMIPQGPSAPPLSKALEQDKGLREIRSNERYKELFDLSVQLDGMTRHISTHAAGVVIADRPITEYTPLCKPGDDIVTQWPGPQIEELGLLKMDYLGLRTLTILDKAMKNIERCGGTAPNLETLSLEDGEAFRLLNSGDTLGVFQLESEGMRKLLARLRPDCFEDIVAVLALYRPGPLESGMDDMFIRRKHGLEEIDYPHDSLEQILKDTYGCLVYQEQVMLISNTLGDFSLNEADNLRKAMGKKKPEIMAQFAEQFIEGAVKNGCRKKIACEIWENIVKFGGYGFNKSHSTAYAMITWHTAYMKAHHRIEFIAANMSCEMSDSDKIKEFVDDARQAEIPVLPPDIERSGWEFLPEDKAIRFGIGAIKGTGKKAIEAMLAGRDRLLKADKHIDLHTLCSETNPQQVTKLAWEAVIKAGSFDSGGHNRGSVLAALGGAVVEGARAAEDRRSGQGALFGSDGPTEEHSEESDGAGFDAEQAFTREDTLGAEYEVLGFYISGHPLEDRAGLFSMLSTTDTRSIQSSPNGGSMVTLAGLVVNFAERTTRAGKKMAHFRLEDLLGGVAVTCFSRSLEQYKELLIDGEVIICRGKIEERSDDDTTSKVGLLLDEVLGFEEALAKFSGALIVRLREDDKDKLEPVARILGEHRGGNRLFVEVEGADGRLRRVRADERYNVKLSTALAQGIEAVLGRGRAKLSRL
ncbi:MAG: DNA polymerase III subunit alpha [Planctomycetes bacterium]|jgi:DNA polymerase-3 subunit alpha|nr:DNA polymerase III subunit alpha [Planctomycetota bacterium]